ncbi:MAG: biosynthetic-type acetolactate synthase large subunit [Candidatus Omnitrophota bacterium]
MKYSGAEIIIKLLERYGIKIIAGIPGGANLPLYDALSKSSIRHILARHEQGAGFIAQGIARTTGKAAICFATSGPGATNLITAIADAKADSVPIIAITGQVPRAVIGTDAFQEVDTCGISRSITKHNFMARCAKELLKIIPQAFSIAESGRPGPVLIDVPKDVQREIIEFDQWPEYSQDINTAEIDISGIRKITDMIHAAKRPVLYIGGGIAQAQAHEFLYKFAKRNSIAVAVTLMGLGCFPPEDELYLGMLGMHGAKHTNLILREADLLLAFGVRFDDRATGNVKKFCPQAKIIHIDIDPSEIDKIKKADISLIADIKDALRELNQAIRQDDRQEWIAYIEQIKQEHPQALGQSKDPLHPLNLIRSVANLVARDTIITTDVGQHQMWVAQAYPFPSPRILLTSGGLGTMGFGLPTAIGAALANPDKRIICISGDGSFLMNIQELATLAELNSNITVIIMNNEHLGLVRQQQEFFYEKNYIASRFEAKPDFIAIAKGFGLRGYDLGKANEPIDVLAEALCLPGSCIVNAPIHYAENVIPMVPPGAANHEMIDK